MNDLILQAIGGFAFGGAVVMIVSMLCDKYRARKSDQRVTRMVESRWRPVFRDRETGEITWRYAVGYANEARAWHAAHEVEILCQPSEVIGVEEIPLEVLLQEFRKRDEYLAEQFRKSRGEEAK